MADTVLVSDLVTYLRCPRLVYFRSRKNDRESAERDVDARYLAHLLSKELALTYHRAAACEDAPEALRIELDRIVNDLSVVYRAELAGVDRSMIRDAADSIDTGAIGSRIADVIRKTGRDELLVRITPCAVEYAIYSDALGIAGSPDKLVRVGDRVLPYMIRTGDKPENGVWKPDRLQITAYSMLVEERFGQVVEYGFVEYARFFEIREVVIRSRDRRRVLELRNRVRMIKGGRMPDRAQGAPCDLCVFEEDCVAKRSLASKFW
ncbi:MAG: Dna2/Cas4 domain-containing protein [ANME-2 cluster archaeon]|jgi:CRISPR-associated exonuclease Cas4|nr:MAG: Dna2/Cas4 domain-containing protein [ANME-2 cluster archaeon]